MKAYKASLIAKEFLFLKQILEKLQGPSLRQVQMFRVQRGTSRLLEATGNENSYSSSLYDNTSFQLYFSVCNGKVRGLEPSKQWAMGDGSRGEETAPTNGEQLLVLGIDPEYIVEVTRDDPSYGDNSPTFWGVVIHKMKGDLGEYHAQQFILAANELAAEMRAALPAV